jgi:glycine/D-amino acid oxidase-like deaminating enzyme
MTIIILGTGIIGTSTAYYLSQSQTPSSIHLVEPSPTLFASASGYAGGFLARDWFSPSVAALGGLSFEEHRRLAEEHNGREKWGYSKSTGTSYTPGKGKTMSGKNGADWLRHGASRAEAAAVGVSELVDEPEEGGPAWLKRGNGDRVEVISEEGTTAQVWV